MDRRGSSDNFGSLILIVVGVIFGYLCFVVAEYYTEWLALIVFLVNILIASAIYYSINKKYHRIAQSFIIQAVKHVKNISAGESPVEIDSKPFNSEVNELYSAINAINDTLKTQDMTNRTVLEIINSIALNIELEQMISDILPIIIRGTGSNWGAFYTNNTQTEKLELKCSIGFSKNIYEEFDIPLGEGFVGANALTDKIEIFNDVPDDTVYVSKTFLGKIKPKAIMVVPVLSENKNVASLVLASIYNYDEPRTEIVNLIRYYLGTAVSNAEAFERTKRLKNELVFQNQLIQNMNEELEQKVEQRTNFLNGVLDSIIDYAIISMDSEGYITMWNKGAELMKGFTEAEVVGKHISETYPENDRDKPMKRLEVAKTDGKVEDFSWTIRKDGTFLYAHIIVTAIYNDMGYLMGYTNITRDITTIKSLEQKASYLSYLVDLHMTEDTRGLIIVNADGFVLNASAKAAELLRTKTEELCDSAFENRFVNAESYRKELERCLNDLTKASWKDTVIVQGKELETDISVSGWQVPASLEKFALVYIEQIENA